jgi:Protein of unknown function (DUF2771)
VDVTATGRGLTGTVLLAGLVTLGGCGSAAGSAGKPPPISVKVGDQEVSVDPTQFCLDGDGRRYNVTPPILEAVADSPITLTVPQDVADAGWGVQVYDEKLEERIGQVDVDRGTTVFDGINSSDVVPPTFYLVVVEDSNPKKCSGLAGAWPVGFIRAPAPAGTSASAVPTPSG